MNAKPGHSSPHDRRRFWRRLLGEGFALKDEAKGIVQMSLDDLESVPAEVLGEMVPVWRKPFPHFAKPDGIYRIGPETGEERRVHAFVRDEERFFADRVGGGINLADIALRLQRSGFAQDAWPTVRELFVSWCRRGWCQPAAAHCLSDTVTACESREQPPT